jgi:glycosyltransferase involved in cell wall biosynthesis
VVIPTYNRANLLPRAVESALRAIEPGDEVIVVDDGSTDATPEAVAPFRDQIRYVPTSHCGAGPARNLGIELAAGDLIAFLDSDDEWTGDKLRLQRPFMARCPDVLFSFSDFATRANGRDELHHSLATWRDDPRGFDEILGPGQAYSTIAPLPPGRDDFCVHVGDLHPELLDHDLVPTFTLVVNRAAAGGALHFAEDLPTYEDLECHVRLAQVGRGAFLDCETARQWSHGGARLSGVDWDTWSGARITIVERHYRADRDFMAHHADLVEQSCTRQHLVRARRFVGVGDTRAARDELRRAGRAPISYRVLARLPRWRPAWLRRVVRAVRRTVRSRRGDHGHDEDVASGGGTPAVGSASR